MVFETYVELVLAPTLPRGQVVMDNLTAHKGERVGEIIEVRGCELTYLPSYTPDPNPIEEAFSKIMGLIRKSEARVAERLSVRGDGNGDLGSQCPRCVWLLRALRLPCSGPTVSITAVACIFWLGGQRVSAASTRNVVVSQGYPLSRPQVAL